SRQGVVTSTGYWNSEAWQWRLKWTVRLLPFEAVGAVELEVLLADVQPSLNLRLIWLCKGCG
ncbi:hypothetical protein A2U01_0054395, partial [Trifolium medium]|nr:hypothetical protein [Trifolium medium]